MDLGTVTQPIEKWTWHRYSKQLTVSQLSYMIDRDHSESPMAAQTSMLHVRVDDDTKAQATEALAAMGLSVLDAVRLFLRRVVIDQAFPIELKVPNAATRAAMKEADVMARAGRARFATGAALIADLEKSARK